MTTEVHFGRAESGVTAGYILARLGFDDELQDDAFGTKTSRVLRDTEHESRCQ